MAQVFDVAEYILGRLGPLSAIKLQKLVYYSQAWHAVARDEPLFGEPTIAHQYGPLCTPLWEKHRGRREVSPGFFVAGQLPALLSHETDIIDSVLNMYGSYSMTALVDRTHRESPWKDEAETGGEITWKAMRDFYAELLVEGKPSPAISDVSTVSYLPEPVFEQLTDDELPDEYSGFLSKLQRHVA